MCRAFRVLNEYLYICIRVGLGMSVQPASGLGFWHCIGQMRFTHTASMQRNNLFACALTKEKVVAPFDL